jgi:hypothetical protein
MNLRLFKVPLLTGLLLGLSPALAAAADDPLDAIPSLHYDLLRISFELSQSAGAEFEATRERTIYRTRFIPTGISAYSYPEDGRTRVIILAKYTHAGSITTNEEAKLSCERMIHWVRFHLGVKDGGDALIAYASDFPTSNLHRWVRPREGATVDASLAAALDAATVVLGSVNNIGGGGRGNEPGIASCKQPLVQAGSQVRIDTR